MDSWLIYGHACVSQVLRFIVKRSFCGQTAAILGYFIVYQLLNFYFNLIYVNHRSTSHNFHILPTVLCSQEFFLRILLGIIIHAFVFSVRWRCTVTNYNIRKVQRERKSFQTIATRVMLWVQTIHSEINRKPSNLIKGVLSPIYSTKNWREWQAKSSC